MMNSSITLRVGDFGKKKRVTLNYIKLIKDMYDRSRTSKRARGGSEFPRTISLYQGSILVIL